MDLSALMNDGAAIQGDRSRPSSHDHNRSQPIEPQRTMTATLGQQTGFPERTPLVIAPQHQARSTGLTPVQSPHLPGSSQHSYFGQPAPTQSALAVHPGQQYRPYDALTSSVPAAGTLHFSQPPQTSPHQGPGYHQPSFPQPGVSLSPTPSSHRSHSSQPVRLSPMATTSHSSIVQNTHYQQHPQSQPTTPLGPPQVPQRHTTHHVDVASPYHQRASSAASNSTAVASPAHPHSGVSSLMDSPGVHQRPSPLRRETSDYLGSMERERSVSVSPKTVAPRRPSSMGSRQSSMQEAHSARSSVPPGATGIYMAETPNHSQPPASTYTQPRGSSLHSNENLDGFPQARREDVIDGVPSRAENAKTHQSQKMVMSHLLAPTGHVEQQLPPQTVSHHHRALTKITDSPSHANGLSELPPDGPHSSREPTQTGPDDRVTSFAATAGRSTAFHERALSPLQGADAMDTSFSPGFKSTTKRPADFDSPNEPPLKRGRRRKYTERPIWAQLSRKNPHYEQPDLAAGESAQSLPSANRREAEPQRGILNGTNPPYRPHAQQNVSHLQADHASEKPWLVDPPLDEDVVNARKVLGKWEKSFQWGVPIQPLTKAVMDWLYSSLEQNSDVGHDPHEGVIEIEAKIGTLIDKNTGQRCSLPVENATVISASENKRFNFDSQMNETEHRNMNKFLNEAVQRSRGDSGREPIMYEHIRETDSFRALSDIGRKALPPAAQKRQIQRDLKVRTSVQDKTGDVSARIVKIPLGDHLHIYGANEPYDVRISMNLEINLDKAGLDQDALIEEPSVDKPPPPSRHKDRLSYRHLVYHVDLTRVDVKGLPPKYELELEVDASVLREQIALAKSQHKNAYMEVVEGFLANTLWLMKQRR